MWTKTPAAASCSSSWCESCVSQQGLGGWVAAPEQSEHLCRGLAASQGQNSVPVCVGGGGMGTAAGGEGRGGGMSFRDQGLTADRAREGGGVR